MTTTVNNTYGGVTAFTKIVPDATARLVAIKFKPANRTRVSLYDRYANTSDIVVARMLAVRYIDVPDVNHTNVYIVYKHTATYNFRPNVVSNESYSLYTYIMRTPIITYHHIEPIVAWSVLDDFVEEV